MTAGNAGSDPYQRGELALPTQEAVPGDSGSWPCQLGKRSLATQEAIPANAVIISPTPRVLRLQLRASPVYRRQVDVDNLAKSVRRAQQPFDALDARFEVPRADPELFD